MHPRSIALPFRIILFASAAILLSLVPFSVFGQDKKEEAKPTPNASKEAKKEEPKPTPVKISEEAAREVSNNPTAEQVV